MSGRSCACWPPAERHRTEPYNLTAPVQNLATLFNGLFGPRGLIVDSEARLPGEQSHSAHFNSDFQFDFSQFRDGACQSARHATIAVASFRLHLRVRSQPRRVSANHPKLRANLTERAETVGARRVSFGFASQRFTFDTAEGLDCKPYRGLHPRQRRASRRSRGRGDHGQLDRGNG